MMTGPTEGEVSLSPYHPKQLWLKRASKVPFNPATLKKEQSSNKTRLKASNKYDEENHDNNGLRES